MAPLLGGQVGVAADAVLFGQRREVDGVDRSRGFRRAGVLGGGHGVAISRVVEQAILLVALGPSAVLMAFSRWSSRALRAPRLPGSLASASNWMRWSRVSVARNTARNSSGVGLK